MKRIAAKILTLLLIPALVLCAVGCEAEASTVYVETVAVITGYENLGARSSYTGVIEVSASYKYFFDTKFKLGELYVEVGDNVRAGDMLYSIDTEDMELSLERLELDYQSIENTLAGMDDQMISYQKALKSATKDEKFEITIQIQELEIGIKETEYSLKAKKLEIDSAKEAMQNTVIYSENDGVVQKINENVPLGTNTENDTSYITLISDGEYRVKGTINEQNKNSIIPGETVTIRSRFDETQVWSGVITAIDYENPIQQGGEYYGIAMEDSAGTASTNYPFYVELETSEGLRLGQHVFIEPYSDALEGLWLNASYIVPAQSEGDAPYVWAANSKMKIEKREITLGEYDEATGSYEVTQGLEYTDLIAYPENVTGGENAVLYSDAEPGGQSGEPGGDDTYIPEPGGDGSMEEPIFEEPIFENGEGYEGDGELNYDPDDERLSESSTDPEAYIDTDYDTSTSTIEDGVIVDYPVDTENVTLP